MTTLEILIAARKLIEKPENWTQHAAARNRLGNRIGALEPSACAWCVSGALFRAAGRFNTSGHTKAWDAIKIANGYRDIVYANDTGTHDEALTMLDAAIERERKSNETPTPVQTV